MKVVEAEKYKFIPIEYALKLKDLYEELRKINKENILLKNENKYLKRKINIYEKNKNK